MMTELARTRDGSKDVLFRISRASSNWTKFDAEDLASARWPLGRTPYIFRDSLPGVFAVGDVRRGQT